MAEAALVKEPRVIVASVGHAKLSADLVAPGMPGVK